MRLAALLLLACGGSPFAPVVAELDDSQLRCPGCDLRYISMAANKKLNPACAANCELGDAFPDGGGSRFWVGASGGNSDGGPQQGPPQDVAIGAVVDIVVASVDPVTCTTKHEVPAGGFTVIAVVHADATCSFSYSTRQ